MQLERIALHTIAKVDVLRDLTEVFIVIEGRKPGSEARRWWRNSPGNRWASFSPSQARRLAYRLIEAASKVERKQDRFGFWPAPKQ
jgi:hypothetical protein